MPEPIMLLLGLLAAGAWVVMPLRARPVRDDADADEREAAAIRHRSALEALRDVLADRRAGALDEAAYREQLADAEARALATRPTHEPTARVAPHPSANGVRLAMGAGVAICLVVLAGSIVPAAGIANTTVRNEALAAAEAAEASRQARIAGLLDELAADPRDAQVLSDLADAYLEGSEADDLVRAVVALRALLELEPERSDAYERTVAAYLRAGDGPNARAALESYRRLATADPVEVAFLDGIVALRLEDDRPAAAAAFDRFLELAPDDPRAGMVRGLRDEAAGS